MHTQDVIITHLWHISRYHRQILIYWHKRFTVVEHSRWRPPVLLRHLAGTSRGHLSLRGLVWRPYRSETRGYWSTLVQVMAWHLPVRRPMLLYRLVISTNLKTRGPSQYTMSSYHYRDPHVKDETVSWPSYLKHKNSNTWERRSLYWFLYWGGALASCSKEINGGLAQPLLPPLANHQCIHIPILPWVILSLSHAWALWSHIRRTVYFHKTSV